VRPAYPRKVTESNPSKAYQEGKMRIYVGNLPKDANEDDLLEMFEEYGRVRNIKIVRDRFSNHSRGYGFLELPDEKSARQAIDDWDQGSIDDHIIKVDVAKASRDYDLIRNHPMA
jgi:RNA recognition motif-containing protein